MLKTAKFCVHDKLEIEDTSISTGVPNINVSLECSVTEIRPLSIIWHPSCVLHHIPNHPECPQRVDSILDALHTVYPTNIFVESQKVSDEQILMFHTRAHLDLLLRKHKQTSVQHIVSFDPDTSLIHESLDAIYYAAGAVIRAVDQVFKSESRSVFCAVRPPGHHAERSKICGFCFLSNAGIGARYAQDTYGIEKVAVLDFDVHHGNGTEEGFTPHPNLFYGSTHEKDNFPGTGKDPSPYVGERARNPLHRRIVNRYLHSDRFHELTSVREEFHEKWAEIIKEMILFKPGLIIISAGFDAHDDDPLASCDLLEEDFEWATTIVMDACVKINSSHPPPCISVLEGGYHLGAIARSAVAHCRALEKGYPIEVNTEVKNEFVNEDIVNELINYQPATSIKDAENAISKLEADIASLSLSDPAGTGNDSK